MKTIRAAWLTSLLAFLLAIPVACGTGAPIGNRPVDVAGRWTLVHPSSEGVDPKQLGRVDRQIRAAFPTLEALLVVRHGQIVFERTYHQGVHDLRSVSKSVISLLVGMAIGEGSIKSLDQTLGEFLPKSVFVDADPRVRAITLSQLLRMRAGFQLDSDATGTATFYGSRDWVAAILARPLTNEPGSVYTYDDGATHLLSAVLTRAVKMPASEFARTHLFRPIGIADGSWSWGSDPQGNTSAADLFLNPRDLARLGHLLAHDGRWNGAQIVPRDYLSKATKTSEVVQIPIPRAPRQGYGYHFWIVDKTVAPQLGSTTGFAAVGYGAQSLVVVPGLDLVVVTRGQLTPNIAPADFWDLVADIVSSVRP